MKTLDCIFVTSGRHPETEALILKATGGQYAHAATKIEIEGKPWIIEATLDRGVHTSKGTAFDDCDIIQVISIRITEEQRKAIVDKAFDIVGKPYGKDDCVIGGARDLLNDRIASVIDRVIDNDDSYNCSGAQTELVRAAFPDYAFGWEVSKITPERARLFALDLQERINRGEEK